MEKLFQIQLNQKKQIHNQNEVTAKLESIVNYLGGDFMKNIDVEGILSKAQEMQGQFQKMQEEFVNKEIIGTAGIDDADQIFVKVVINGMRMVKSLYIGQGALEQETKVKIDLIIAAMNNATEKLNDEMQKEVKKIYKAPGMPSGETKTE